MAGDWGAWLIRSGITGRLAVRWSLRGIRREPGVIAGFYQKWHAYRSPREAGLLLDPRGKVGRWLWSLRPKPWLILFVDLLGCGRIFSGSSSSVGFCLHLIHQVHHLLMRELDWPEKIIEI